MYCIDTASKSALGMAFNMQFVCQHVQILLYSRRRIQTFLYMYLNLACIYLGACLLNQPWLVTDMVLYLCCRPEGEQPPPTSLATLLLHSQKVCPFTEARDSLLLIIDASRTCRLLCIHVLESSAYTKLCISMVQL